MFTTKNNALCPSLDELLDCVNEDDIDRLDDCLRDKWYASTSFYDAKINKEKETLLHYACRLTKPNVIEYLLSNSICNPLSVDCNGNTPLHLLLKTVLLIDVKENFMKGILIQNLYHSFKHILVFIAYRRLVLANLQDLAPSLDKENNDGETARELLEMADSVVKYHSETSKKLKTERKANATDEAVWERKLAEEVEDEYASSWGKYEDFQEDAKEPESYDEWADRMLREHEKKKRPRLKPVATKSVAKPSWSKEDQEAFLKKEKMYQEQLKKTSFEEKRVAFLSKLKLMVQNESTIEKSDLPFDCSEKTEAIGDLILLHVKEMQDEGAKRKALRELQRLWHPDKFAQIFGQRLSESICESVLKKVTEISQYINAFSSSLS